uniref:Alpha-tubulin N-acetyltransferase n=1 Tax=Syphacia muris TaxID=451379 RepID=A0A0N5ABR5_9BILA
MELESDLSQLFGDNHVVRLDEKDLKRLNPRKCWSVKYMIDGIGAMSAAAQGLKKPLTTYDKILDSYDTQIVYILWQKHSIKNGHSEVVGLLKVGYKTLYLLDSDLNKYSVKPLCALDFYVHEKHQRKGFGRQLFDFMLNSEQCSAEKVAIDKPSEALLQFMCKSYGLNNPLWQMNSFVVYPGFFADLIADKKTDNEINFDEKGDDGEHQQATYKSKVKQETAVAKLIHDNLEILPQVIVAPNTPKGLKNSRDLGHQCIW